MKKIIRIASVIALACASLVYVGCTKDFSADIAKTNSDVSALKSKVDALDATVQTINSTVANLQTTKADLSVVNALEASLNGKIDGLTADLEEAKADIKAASDAAAAAQLTAEGAQKAAEQAAADLKAAKAELDTVIAGVNEKIETLEVNTDSLRKDVDSLYKNSVDFENRIAALEGKVEDIAARVNSIVAVPSYVPQVVMYSVDTIGATDAITDTIFTASFAVTPKTAASSFSKKNATLIFKNGLERMALNSYTNNTINDTVIVPSMVSVNEELGVVTVYAPVNVAAFQPLTRDAVSKVQPYYSLVFEAEDNAGEYAIASSFSKVNVNLNDVKSYGLDDIIVLQAEDEFAKVGVDTISYAEKADTVFSTAFGKNKRFEVVALVNESTALSLKDFAAIVGTKPEKLAIDTVYTITDSVLCNDSTSRCSYKDGEVNVTSTGWQENKFRDGGDCRDEYLFWQDRYNVGSARPGKDLRGNGIQVDSTTGKAWKVKATDNKFYGNKTVILYSVKAAGQESNKRKCADILYIGAKNLGTYDLGKTSEEWYYDYAKNGITATYTIINEKAAKAIKDTLVSGNFSVSAKSATSVNVDVNKVAYAKVAADTTYNVTWATHNDLSAKGDSTIYSIAWAYKVGPRPADPEAIKFAAADTIIGKKVIDVEFEGVYEASIAAVDELDNRSVIGTPKAVSVDGVKVSEKAYKGPKVTFSWTNEKTVDAKIDKAEAGKTYVIVAEADCAGITFTYEFTVTVVSKATPKLKALTTFVKEEGGKYSIEVAAPAPDTSASANNGKYIAALKSMEFSKYFIVDTTEAVLTGLYAGFKTTDTTSTNKVFVNNTDKSVVGADKVTFDNKKFNWAPYDSTIANVVAYLITNAQDTIDNVAIKFWTKEPIKSVAHKDSVIKHNNSNADEIDLVGLFTVTDYMDSTVIKNGVTNLKGTWDYEFNFKFDKDNWTISGGTLPEGALKLNGTTLTLAAEGAQIVNPVTVEIPFVLSHALDKFGKAADDRQGTVKVTFTSAE